MSKEKMLETAKKLKALAEQGIGGEKDNAGRMLEMYMEKHGITEEMLEDEEIGEETFYYDIHFIRLFAHCVANTIDVNELQEYHNQGIKKQHTILKMKKRDAIVIRMKYDFFVEKLKREEDLFMTAFFHKNNLFAAFPIKESKKSSMSFEEVLKMKAMMSGIDEYKYTKSLNQ